MICKLHLCVAVLLTALEVMLGHPVVQTGDMTYGRPVLVEDDQVVSPEDLSYSEQAFLSQGSAGFGYPSIITGDLGRDGLRTAGFVPRQAVKEVLLEKQLMNPLSRFLGGRKQYHKRGSNSECFWKYCV
ncbi:prepro-urotensin II-beta [Triplophysa rosa]|uniref:Prepro-urotensin II-beta n=1 Tax=Triplophysa rosa TaxID=992332 RepID=A0A9W7TEV8_TRIRA|nr:prepro-urotensin II-beta [Triplophysa rosa]KAI7795201.1 prepro-urotensin II-beta precursor [Triplophysa rosa]